MTIYIIVRDLKPQHGISFDVLAGGSVYTTEADALAAIKSFEAAPLLAERNTYRVVARDLYVNPHYLGCKL